MATNQQVMDLCGEAYKILRVAVASQQGLVEAKENLSKALNVINRALFGLESLEKTMEEIERIKAEALKPRSHKGEEVRP